MKLDQEISFKSISKLFEKKKPVRELKTEINFFDINKTEKKSVSGAIPMTIIAVIIIAVLAKFTVYDRYAMLISRQENVDKLQSDIDNANKVLENSGELQERFYHYTTSMMTEEEKDGASRAEIMSLLRFMEDQGVKVSGTTLSGNVMVTTVEADNLKSVSELSQSLKGQKIVSTVNVTMAQTTSNEYRKKKTEGVTASVTVYLKTKSQLREED